MVRQYNEELKYLEKINDYCWKIKKGFQPNMKVIFIITYSIMFFFKLLLFRADFIK